MEKFKCDECGCEMDEDTDICDDCMNDYYDEEDEGEEE